MAESNGIHMPRVMFAAGKSGGGKTTVTCGFLAAVLKRKLRVCSYKCGPDYIDPMFHRAVLGIDAGNLDTFFADADTVRAILAADAPTCDLVVVEGVMGYYDGLGGVTDRASSYELAAWTKTPVILIADAKGVSVTLAATIRGIMEYRVDSRICGVILNRVSGMFYPRLKQVIEQACGVPVVGYLPEREELAVPSRHLGLLTPEELTEKKAWVQMVCEAAEQMIDVDKILQIAGGAEDLEIPTSGVSKPTAAIPTTRDWSFGQIPGVWTIEDLNGQIKSDYYPASGFRIGVARDAAFSFYYRENLRFLQAIGGELVFFSPLADACVPDVDALIFGGGYPELYVRQLSENVSMRSSVRAALERGIPCHAECGGFLYLGQTLADADGNRYDMVGFLPGDGYPTGRLQRFGYVELIPADAPDADSREILRGHEFHYWDSTFCGGAYLAAKPLAKDKTYPCMVKKGRLLAGFPHLYYLSNPEFFRRLFV